MRRFNLIAGLVIVYLTTTPIMASAATTIEVTQNYTLGAISGTFGEGQVLNHTHQPFDPIVLGLGDTLVFTFLFDQRLEVFDFNVTDQHFVLGLDCRCQNTPWSGTWTSSIEALGGLGDMVRTITLNWRGGGAGIGSGEPRTDPHQ